MRRLAGTEAWKLEVLSSREVASEGGRADRPTDWGGGHQQGGAHLQFGSRIREGLRVGLRLPPWLPSQKQQPLCSQDRAPALSLASKATITSPSHSPQNVSLLPCSASHTRPSPGLCWQTPPPATAQSRPRAFSL